MLLCCSYTLTLSEPRPDYVWNCAGVVDARGNYFPPCGWFKKDMSPYELVEGCKACAQLYRYRVKVPVAAGPPLDGRGPAANVVSLGAGPSVGGPSSAGHPPAHGTWGGQAGGQ